ncbi:hypothetical protein NM208_g4833 [Fusarium decemcellulare]|uniref:Uncharacterized protein n=1 Tax=Fusarium decemcellulare TaxID=57161 RepID=A0ACC1SJK4_9HYPO|nr:hypothetical protein NM208_g4833 [Fusarium decemcellulare]
MSLLATYATVLGEFVYDPNVAFWHMEKGEVPCFYCVQQLARDPHLGCIVEDSGNCCLICRHDRQKCGSMPRELWGAAQFFWNAAHGLVEEIEANFDDYTTLQLWRVNASLHDCCYYWRKVSKSLTNPLRQTSGGASMAAQVQTQELASSRELLSLLCLQQAGANLSLADMTQRVAAAAPAYVRDDGLATLLRDAIKHLDGCENSPRDGVPQEGRDLKIKDSLAFLQDRYDTALDNGHPGPICPVSFVGLPPRRRGPGDHNTAPGGCKRT